MTGCSLRVWASALCALAVSCVPSGACGASQPVVHDIGSLLELVARVHQPDRAFVTEAVIPGPPVSLLSDRTNSVIDESSRIRWIEHPLTGERVIVFADVTETYDGAGRLRVEFRHATTVGPQELSTSVEIWTPDSWFVSSQIGAPVAERHAIDTVTLADLHAQKQQGITPYMETRAFGGSYLDAVSYILFVLRNCPDAEFSVDAGDHAVIESKHYDLDAEIDTETGELLSFGIGHEWGVERVWYVGRMDAELFPARHPVERRARVVRGQKRSVPMAMPTSSDAGMLVYHSARAVADVASDQFHWQSVAKTLLDHSTGSVHGPDGEVDEEATARMKDLLERASQPLPPLTTKAADGRVVPRRVRWSNGSRAGVAVSVALLVLGGTLWARRRFQ